MIRCGAAGLRFVFLMLVLSAGPAWAGPAAAGSDTLRILFLGDRGHHQPAERAHAALAPLRARGIDLFYSERLDDLRPEMLARHDGLLLYANHTELTPAREKALLDYVAAGGGFAPIHCASACFGNSDPFIELVGARFARHDAGVFRTTITATDHPLMAGLGPHESWDETYVHDRHNDVGRTILAVREEGGQREPWTWVRTHGEGRVFYTAWGHDLRTWSQEWFHELLARGLRFACGDDQPDRPRPAGPFRYTRAEVPLYQPGSQGRASRMQEPLTPEQSVRRMVVPPGLAVELFAAEPQIVKPIDLAFDARGRLWIAETVDYPNALKPEGQGRDRIRICEDSDGDGRADRFRLFADRLSIPTSLLPYRDGVIVAQAPDMLFLRDTDGDDVADVRERLFTGFGTADTHAGPSNLWYGFDNWIWGTVGYSGFRGTVGGEEHRFGQGIFRFRPDGSRLEFLSSTTNNTWGLGFSEEGLVFGSTANGNPSVHLAIPNRYYEAVHGGAAGALATIAESIRFHPVTEQVRQVDYHGQFTAAAGHTLYTARAFPREYWNRVALVSGPTGHLLHRFLLEPSGTHFVARDRWNLLASDDEWTAPVCAEVGPDGAVWMIDWYAYIVQHNPTPKGFETGRGNAYVTPLRDKKHGRIVRIVPREGPLDRSLDLAAAAPAGLVAALGHDNLFWRQTAQRLLVERNETAALPLLLERLADRSSDGFGMNPAVLHALFALDGLGLFAAGSSTSAGLAVQAGGALRDLLGHPAMAVRRAALSVLPASEVHREALLDAGVLNDAEPHVRLAALLALSRMPPSRRAGSAVFEAMRRTDNQEDRWIPVAAAAAAAQNDAGFLAAVLASDLAREPADRGEVSDNLLPNPSFEEVSGDQPAGWSVRHYGGQADHRLADVGHSGRHSLEISSTEGADTSWHCTVPVERNGHYRLSAWIRTESVELSGGAEGALLNVHELQSPTRVRTGPITASTDWTRVETSFETGGRDRISINCLFGGWGPARGKAWFDDLRLERITPGGLPGTLGRILASINRHYAARAPVDSVVSTLALLGNASAGVATSCLEGLAQGWPADRPPALGDEDRVVLLGLLRELPEEARPHLLLLLEQWNVKEGFAADAARVVKSLRIRLSNPRRSVAERVTAAERLLGLEDGPDSVDRILDQISVRTDPALATDLLLLLASSRRAGTGERIVARWPGLTPASRGVAVTVLCRRSAWAATLLDAVDRGDVAAGAIATHQWVQLENHPDGGVAQQARVLRGRPSDDNRDAVLTRLAFAAELEGDRNNGARLYAEQCAACHLFAGQGGRVGPPLDGIGARPRSEILTEVLDPNRSVEENYRLWIVQLEDGGALAGRLAAESKTTIELLDLGGGSHVVRRAEIRSLESAGVSIMPATFEILGPQGLADLLEYLCGSGHAEERDR